MQSQANKLEGLLVASLHTQVQHLQIILGVEGNWLPQAMFGLAHKL